VAGTVVSATDAARFYRVLGVSPDATRTDVRRAFRDLVRRYHPDSNPGAKPGAELAEIVAAYKIVGVRAKPAPPPPAPPQHVDVYA
jgi:curved DNA-binding protein CbpA